ncbi:MAG: 16S rRNA (cytosine(1402)-N(4))-methyltransferase RsmH [Ruminococcaceae bacterium]|nr:16S rRNA (cytosine(1402)-N(4))-methyltransferase RsmH [Oscillospiraceae bacterium]
MAEFKHYSVMLGEAVESLNIKPDGVYVDATAGGGGHSYEIASRLTTGKLYCVDQDSDAIAAAKKRLEPFMDRVEFIKDNFENLKFFLSCQLIDGILLDLGISSYQLDTPERGFSYMHDAPLDMRMNRDAQFDCRKLINEYSVEELTRVLRDWGEERFAYKIARNIVETREVKPIETTGELVEIVERSIPAAQREHHAEKRTFQALRIEVNRELDIIEPTIRNAADMMNPGGRIVVITFHSLEDRIVKQTFADLSRGCTCPPDFPVCVCGNKPKGRVITRKPILPSKKELEENSRSKSAKLRVFEKI